MAQYDSEQFDPPAPIAIVVIRNPETQSSALNVPMLIDTGADVTLIPRAVAEQLGLATADDGLYELSSFNGGLSSAVAVQAELQFLRRTFRGQFLLIDQPIGILGRNVLNTVRLVLDGPRLSWDEA
ncbi:MAG: clan AA aspartic protease [Chloroflexi bacterium]|nr:clan AA aspartic protease [Chloroflexota bacterium]